MKRPEGISRYRSVKIARDLSGLFNARFNKKTSVVVLPRALDGDFDGLAYFLADHFKGKDTLALKDIEAVLPKLVDGKHKAASHIISDMQAATKKGLYNELRVLRGVKGYEGDDSVFEYHADGGDLEADDPGRILCCYTGPVTEWLRHDQVLEHPNNPGFFAAKDGARPQKFRVGDIWCQATDAHPRPLIHRAPFSKKGAPPKLLFAAETLRMAEKYGNIPPSP